MNSYTIFITPAAWKEIADLSARFRHRVREAVEAFAENPRPSKSKILKLSELAVEVRRLRIERWRNLYAINESDEAVDVLAVRSARPTTMATWNPC